ncbi:MAG: AraC family transcriptional regulator [bacterium]
MKPGNTKSSYFRSSARDLLPYTRFALDKHGVLLDIDRNVSIHIGLSKTQMISQKILDFLIPLYGQTKKQLLEIILKWRKHEKTRRFFACNMPKFPQAHGAMHTVQVYVVPDLANKTAAVHGIISWEFMDSPGYKKHYSVTKTSETGFVFLDAKNRILDFDFNFIEYANIHSTDLDELRGMPLKALIDPYYIPGNWLDDKAVIKYLKEIAEKDKTPWNLVYSTSGESAEEIEKEWIVSPFADFKFNKGVINLFSKINVLSSNYLILDIPLNLPDNDLKIEYECMSDHPSDLSPVLGSNHGGKAFNPDEIGYFFGFGCNGEINDLQRKTVRLDTNRKLIPKPDKWHKCSLERAGGRFTFCADNRIIFRYFDPRPIFNICSSYFSFYFFSQRASLKNIRVWVRKSRLDFERLAHLNQHHIVFKTNAGRLFEIRRTTGYWMSSQAILIFFKDISQYMDMEKQKKIRAGDVKNVQLERARQYIIENFSRNINYRELSRNYHMSYSHFITSFRKSYGVSPKDYQIDLRLKRAKQMLCSGQYKIKDIALLNGYEDERGFYQIFIKREGISPSGYVERHTVPGTADGVTV